MSLRPLGFLLLASVAVLFSGLVSPFILLSSPTSQAIGRPYEAGRAFSYDYVTTVLLDEGVTRGEGCLVCAHLDCVRLFVILVCRLENVPFQCDTFRRSEA